MVETGVGAGLWLSGNAYRGAHTNAGEFGHSVVQFDGPACVCGRHGCLEVVHDRAVAAGDIALAARVLASGVVDLLQTIDVEPGRARRRRDHAARTGLPRCGPGGRSAPRCRAPTG